MFRHGDTLAAGGPCWPLRTSFWSLPGPPSPERPCPPSVALTEAQRAARSALAPRTRPAPAQPVVSLILLTPDFARYQITLIRTFGG